MVIDVLFADSDLGGLRYSQWALASNQKVVEVLNAIPCATSSRTCAIELLRSIAAAQREHQGKIDKAQKALEDSRSKVAALKRKWEVSCTKGQDDQRDRLRRFTVLLQAKVIAMFSLA